MRRMSERKEVFCQICDKKLVASPNVCVKVLENSCFCSRGFEACASCEMYDFICAHCHELTQSDRKELEYLIEERNAMRKRLLYLNKKIPEVRSGLKKLKDGGR